MGGACVPVKATGVACIGGHECSSTYCIDGTCCGTNGCPTCQACNVSGSPGTCTNVSDGTTELHNHCGANGTCGNTGTCTGGACTQAPPSVNCAPASCSSTTFTPAAFCSGSGTCATPTTSSCAPYVCGGTSCNSTCANDSQCVPNSMGVNTYCTTSGGTCQPVKGIAVACLSNHECASGFCVDGVCCTSNGCGTCLACNVSGSVGNCANVPINITDPHGRCGANGTCGNTGACTGGGACQQQPSSVMCSGPACSGGVGTVAAFCSGGGTCPTAMTTPCGNYQCGGTACKSSCATDGDCISTAFCSGNVCAAKGGPGATCGGSNQCAANLFCADGVCCTTNGCTMATCQACNVNGNGTCAPIPLNQPAPSGQCTADGTCGNTGLCDGASGCQQAANGLGCAPAVCASRSSQFQAVATCNGAGNCVTPLPTTCSGNLACTSSGCTRTTCAVDTDCASGYYCNGGTCTQQQTSGSCTANDQCAAGLFCTDGYCCTVSSCMFSCLSCGVPGLQGTCNFVPAGGNDPTGACTSLKQPDPTMCGYDGTCNGGGGCEFYSTSTMCGSPTCAAGTSEITALFCDGAGNCDATGNLQSCSPLMCDGVSSCLSSCAQDSDCVSGSCDTGSGTCN
jgi:hypothetical protein